MCSWKGLLNLKNKNYVISLSFIWTEHSSSLSLLLSLSWSICPQGTDFSCSAWSSSLSCLSSTACMYRPHLFYLFRHLDCFHHLAILNKAAVNILRTFIFHTQGRTAEPQGGIHLTSLETASWFSKWLIHFTLLPAVYECSRFSIPSPIVCTACLFDNSHPTECIVVFPSGFNLHITNDC